MQVATEMAYGSKCVRLPLGIGPRVFWATMLSKAGKASFAALILCLYLLLFATATQAQTTGSGSIQGTVTDSSGALVSGAAVKLVESSTQVTLTTKTTSAGAYAFPNINVGTYSVTITAPGFETYTSTGNVLEIGSSIAINATMTIGSADVKVEVHSEGGAALQTEDATFKQTVDSTELTEMPLNGRHMTDLISLVGGTQSAGVGDATGSKFPTQSTTISIAGAQGNAVSYRLDGGDNNDYMGGGNGPLPFPDAVGQFSVETAALGAQSGSQAGGLVNVVTKSGTNSFHGSAFEYVRNNYLDAQNFFSTCTPVAPATTCTAKDTLHQNQYGGTFGGPVRIPKLFDGRNKLFFFAAFQRTKADQSTATQRAYVPTAANLAGDFSVTDPPPGSTGSNLCNAAVQLYDPITHIALPGNKYNQPGGPALPQWNASALALIKQLPPINPAVDVNNCGLVTYSIPNINFDNEFDTRVDYTLGTKDNLYVRYFLDSNQIPSFYSPTNILLTSQSGNPEIRWQTITIGENHVFSASVVNTLHLTGVRRKLSRGFNAATPNINAFGIKDFQSVPSGLWINCSSTSGNHCNTIGGGSNLLAVINDNIPIDVSDDVTWIHGKHQIVFGVSFVRNQLNVNNGYQSNGNLTVNGSYSGADGNLDLLEGALSGFNQSLPQQNALRGSIPSLYAQDTFHVTKKLTLTAGIRWAPLYFPHDVFHRGSVFNMNAFLANQHSSVYPNAPAGIFYYGDAGVKPAFTANSPLEFNPNFAIAYDVFGTGRTVFRAGTAYAYDQPNFFVQQRVQQNPPFSAIVGPNTSGQLCLSDPWLVAGSATSQGCGNLQPGTTTPVAGASDVDPFPFNPASFVFPQQAQYIVLQPTYKMPNTMQWTASVQQQLAHGWNFQIFYTGNRTQHQLAATELNPAVYTPGVWGPGGTGCGPVVTTGPAAAAAGTTGGGPVGTPCSVSSPNLTPALKTRGVTKSNQPARLALAEANPAQGNYYSGGNGGSLIETNNAYGNYNGVTVTAQHRFSTTFNLVTNYTWSKCLNDSDPQGDISGGNYSNPTNPSVDYGRCGSDVRNNFNTYLVLKSRLPLQGIGGYLVNNWEFAPLVRLVSGTPFTVTQNEDESFTGNGGDRPNLVPGVPIYNYTKIKSDTQLGTKQNYLDRSYLNQNAFVANTIPGTQGNISRNSFSNPTYFQDDAQISRIFPIRERYNLDLRFEAFNVLNHPSFTSGNNGANVSNGVATFAGSGSNFGEITSATGARVFQGAVRVFF